VAQVNGHGYRLERGDCCGANGYTDPTRRVVRVRADVDAAQAVKTLAHELGHLTCGHVEDLPTYLTCRGRCEVEAESVAYVAGWAGSDLTRVRRAADTVTGAARTILAGCSSADTAILDEVADAA
jgi:hypothetical protein